MATLSQLHLARAAPAHAKLHLPKLASPCRASLGPIRGGIPTLRIPNLVSKRIPKRNVVAAGMRSPEEFQVQRDDAEIELAKEESNSGLAGFLFPGVEIVTAAGVFLQTALPVHAVILDPEEEMMRFSPEAWVNIYITTGIWVVLYFLVIPLVVYNYLRLRWYKRSFLETYFQFLLVFIFFPGMLLLAPFINFRRLPNDGADGP